MKFFTKPLFALLMVMQGVVLILGQTDICTRPPAGEGGFTFEQLCKLDDLVLEKAQDDEFLNSLDINQRVKDYIDELDIAEEFKNITGISVGAVITILIVIIIIPNLIIIGLIFLCCYCCRCGVFYRGDSDSYDSHDQNKLQQPFQPQSRTTAPIAPSGGYKPDVPVRPANLPQSPNPQQSGSAWPWNNDRQASEPQRTSAWPWNRGQDAAAGHHNTEYQPRW